MMMMMMMMMMIDDDLYGPSVEPLRPLIGFPFTPSLASSQL